MGPNWEVEWKLLHMCKTSLTKGKEKSNDTIPRERKRNAFYS